MTVTIPVWLAELGTPIITGVVVAIIIGLFNRSLNKKQKKRDAEEAKRQEVYKKETALKISMLFSIGKLCYATAIAVRDGETNGEMKDGIKTYSKAKDKYNKFIQDSHVEYMDDVLHDRKEK